MFCTNCGAKIPDGSAFCSMCGSKQPVLSQSVQEESQVQSVEESTYGEPQPVEESVYVQPNYGEPNYGQAAYGQDMYTQAPYAQAQEFGKRKKSPLLPILITVIVLLLIGAGVLTYFLFFRGSNGVAGEYKVVAINLFGYNVDPKIGDPDGNLSDTVEIDLEDSGDGCVHYNGKSQNIHWALEENIFSFTDENGKKLDTIFDGDSGRVEYRNGRIWYMIEDGTGGASSSGAIILAKDGDDLSDLNIQSGLDVIQKIFGSAYDRGGATEPETTSEPIPTVEPTPVPTLEPTIPPVDGGSDPGDTSDVHPELKKAVDEFADYVGEYIEAIHAYKDDPTNSFDKYMDAMDKYSELADKISKIQDELIDKGDYNNADQAYISSIYIPLLDKLTEEMQDLT